MISNITSDGLQKECKSLFLNPVCCHAFLDVVNVALKSSKRLQLRDIISGQWVMSRWPSDTLAVSTNIKNMSAGNVV